MTSRAKSLLMPETGDDDVFIKGDDDVLFFQTSAMPQEKKKEGGKTWGLRASSYSKTSAMSTFPYSTCPPSPIVVAPSRSPVISGAVCVYLG